MINFLVCSKIWVRLVHNHNNNLKPRCSLFTVHLPSTLKTENIFSWIWYADDLCFLCIERKPITALPHIKITKTPYHHTVICSLHSQQVSKQQSKEQKSPKLLRHFYSNAKWWLSCEWKRNCYWITISVYLCWLQCLQSFLRIASHGSKMVHGSSHYILHIIDIFCHKKKKRRIVSRHSSVGICVVGSKWKMTLSMFYESFAKVICLLFH